MTLIKGKQISKSITQANLALIAPVDDSDAVRLQDLNTTINAKVVDKVTYGSLTYFANTFNTDTTTFYVTDKGKEGEFIYDSTDTTSSADGVIVLVKGGKRYKRITDFVTPEMFGAKGDGTTDDAAAFQAAFDNPIVNVKLKGVKYKINSGLTFDISKKSLDGQSAFLDFSTLTSGNAIHVRATGWHAHSGSTRSMRNFTMQGSPTYHNNGNNVVGLYLHEPDMSGVGNLAHYTFRNISQTYFTTGILTGNNTYLNTFTECLIGESLTCVHIGTGSNSGAQMRFQNSYIGGAQTVAIISNINCSVVFTACAIGENKKHVTVNNGGILNFQDCHFESIENISQMIEILSGNGAYIGIRGGTIVTNNATPTPDHYFYINPGDYYSSKLIELDGVFISSPGKYVNKELCGGAGGYNNRFIIRNSFGYINQWFPPLSHISNNMLRNGGFESANLAVDLLYLNNIAVDTGMIVSTNMSNSNVIASLYSSDKHSGTYSLRVYKTGIANSEANIIIGIPIEHNVGYKGGWWSKQVGNTLGNLNWNVYLGSIRYEEGITKIMNFYPIYGGTFAPTTTWEQRALLDFMDRTDTFSTHLFLVINLKSVGPIELLLDDIQISRI